MIEKFNEPDLELLHVLELVQTFKSIKKYYEGLAEDDKRNTAYRLLLKELLYTIESEQFYYTQQLNPFKYE